MFPGFPKLGCRKFPVRAHHSMPLETLVARFRFRFPLFSQWAQ